MPGENVTENTENLDNFTANSQNKNADSSSVLNNNINEDLSNNVINRFFGLFEKVLGSRDFFQADDVNSVQQNYDSESSEMTEETSENFNNSDSAGDTVPDSKEVVDSSDSSSSESPVVTSSFPSPSPVNSDSSKLSHAEVFRQLSAESPRKASRYFEQNAKEILKDVTFV